MGSVIFASQFQNDTELMKGEIFRDEWFRYYEKEPDWSEFDFWIGCDPAATKADVLLSGRKATSDFWTIAVGGRKRVDEGDTGVSSTFVRCGVDGAPNRNTSIS